MSRLQPSALTVSADGQDDTTQSITVDVPSTMDITMFQVGQQVELTVAVQPDGSFLLQGSSEDGNSNATDPTAPAQAETRADLAAPVLEIDRERRLADLLNPR